MSKVTKEHDCQLRTQLQHLQHDWHSYKQSIPRRGRRSCSSTVLMADAAAALELLSNSPKKLMCSLQQIQTPAAEYCSSLIPHDQEFEEVEEIINDQRRHSTSSRGLLEALEEAKDEVCGYGREEETSCSVSSSVLIQGAEEASSGSCSSCGCPLMIDKHVKVAYVSSSTSDSSSSSPEHVDQVDRNVQRDGGVGVKGVMSLALLPIVIVTLAFVVMLVKGFSTEQYEFCCIVPT